MHALLVSFAMLRGYDTLAQRLSDRLVGFPAEHFDRQVIPSNNDALRIHRDDGIQHRASERFDSAVADFFAMGQSTSLGLLTASS